MKKSTKIALFIPFTFLLVLLFGPAIGKRCLRALTPTSTLTTWQAEVERLDRIFPREPSNEAKRLELLGKLRLRGIRLDEGIIEEIDHHFTPYTIAVRIGWSWQELFGLR
jgi:hypothetical protein